MDRIIELINNGEYLKAAEGLAEYVSENAPDFTFYLLSATVNLQFGMYDEAGENAARGLRLSPENYELYMLLEDALESSNKEQAYLCYEQAMYWAKEHQANEMDIEMKKNSTTKVELGKRFYAV